ncbi:hypothetical protein DFS34DRAFT_184038 [Phlyctochytrium arcticum]|nr:hypothetical protein DFS34DRAFT_184038 [Phlyctochytrium arcticum]
MSASILAAAPVSHLPTTTAVRRASLLPTPRPRTHLHPPSHSSHRNSTTDANNIQGPHRSYTHATTAAARRASLRPPAGGPGMKQPPPAHSPYPDPPPPKQESHKPRVTSVKRQGGQEVKTSEGKTFWLTDEEYEYYKEVRRLLFILCRREIPDQVL